MKRYFLSTVLVLVSSTIWSQTDTSVLYFNKRGKTITGKKRAHHSETSITYSDGKITTVVWNIKANNFVSTETYKGEEPFGIWQYGRGPQIDYNFDLIYSGEYCEIDSNCKPSKTDVKITDLFMNEGSINYKAPKLTTGDKDITAFIRRTLTYPESAVANEISGKVMVRFKINDKGFIEQVSIKKGTHPLLDKEAVRIIRLLRFENPPMMDGKPFCLNLMMPLVWQL